MVKAQSFGLFQANFPSYGLSAKYDLNQVHSAQFIYGAFGALEANIFTILVQEEMILSPFCMHKLFWIYLH